MNRQSTLPTYEVEFIPLERRLKDRRMAQESSYSGPERRQARSRRGDERGFAKLRRV